MDKVAKLRSTVGLPELCAKLGLRSNIRHGKSCLSPLRSEKRNSFTAWFKNGEWTWKDYGIGKGGNVITFYREATGSTNPVHDLYNLWFENGKAIATLQPPKIEPLLPPSPLNWQERVDKLTDDMLDKLAEWRAYSVEFCRWLRAIKIIGSYADNYCFPIYHKGFVAQYHVRWPSGIWSYRPKELDMQLTPLVIGSGKVVWCGESQWDIFAVMCSLPMEYVRKCKWVATRGSGNSVGEVTYLLRQRDEKPQAIAAEERWASKNPGRSVWTPKGIKDANDWLREDKEGFEKRLAKWFL